MLKRSVLFVLPLGIAGALLQPGTATADVVCSELTGSCTLLAEDQGSAGKPPERSSQEGAGSATAVSACEERTADSPMETCVAPELIPGGEDAPSPEELAQQAIEELPLPAPEVGLAPKPSGMGLVGLPVWMWVSEEDWSSVSQTASAGSVSVTATASPTSVIWRMGEGSTVICEGPGTPYTPEAKASSSPDCGHTYTRTSADRPEQRYRITATVHWEIAWEGGGASGSADLTRTSSTSLAVGEAQSLVQ
ncbi:hypothetical protein [Allosalinactinospora lopnorensis]|uniref:hypothetical protein n=1 Tax=Allosalinactinospora lopnorensis TaxID=1352348 RepID=UPI000623F07B|nr:hypothetical protein [Allosalinactinospora lopnorensis]